MNIVSAPECDCRTRLSEGWLDWIFYNLGSQGTCYPNSDSLLFEVLGACLSIDVLVIRFEGRSLMHNVVPAFEGSEENLKAWIDNGAVTSDRWSEWILSDRAAALSRIPVFQPPAVMARSASAPGLKVIVGISSLKPEKRLCESCFNELVEFLGRRHRPNLKMPLLGQPTMEDTMWLVKEPSSTDSIATLLTYGTTFFRTTFSSLARQFLSGRYAAEFEDLRRLLLSHKFSFSVILNHEPLAELTGFGYYLTREQQQQVKERLQACGKTDLDIQKAKRQLQGFEFVSTEGNGAGLISIVVERELALWSSRLTSKLIYPPQTKDTENYIAFVEDAVVHSPVQKDPNSDDLDNFVFEVPLYIFGPKPSKPEAVFFFLLAERPSGPLMSLLLLAARLSLRPIMAAVFSGFCLQPRSPLLRHRWTPLLLHEGRDIGSDLLERVFPRESETAGHDLDKILDADLPTIHQLLRKVDEHERSILLQHNDSSLLWLAMESADQPEDARWARFWLKMRVREKQVGLDTQIYVVDLFHYLAGCSIMGSVNYEWKDLTAIVGILQLKSIEKLKKKCHISLSIAVSVKNESKVIIMAEKLPGSGAGQWRSPRGDHEHIANPLYTGWDWKDERDPFYWVVRSRLQIPRYSANHPGGPLGYLLSKLVERIDDDGLDRLNILVRPSDDRIVIEGLWRKKEGAEPSRYGPRELLPIENRTDGGDLGLLRRHLDGQDYIGWFIAFPLRYEDPTVSPSEGDPVDHERFERYLAMVSAAIEGKPKVVVINDDQAELERLSRYFQDAGFSLLTTIRTGNEEDALKQLKLLLLPGQGIFLAIDLFGPNDSPPYFGARLASRLREEGFRQPIIITTRKKDIEGSGLHDGLIYCHVWTNAKREVIIGALKRLAATPSLIPPKLMIVSKKTDLVPSTSKSPLEILKENIRHHLGGWRVTIRVLEQLAIKAAEDMAGILKDYRHRAAIIPGADLIADTLSQLIETLGLFNRVSADPVGEANLTRNKAYELLDKLEALVR